MKILIVTQYFWPENFRINDLAQALTERGHQVTVLTGMPNYPHGKFFKGYGWKGPYVETYGKIKVNRVPLITRGKKKGLRLALNYFSFAFSASVLGPFLCKGDFDRIFIYEVSPVTVALPGIVLKYVKKAPIYFWVTDLWPDTLVATNTLHSPFLLNLVSRLVRFIYRHCDTILVASRGFIPKIQEQKTPPKKIIYWPQWAEALFSQNSSSPSPSPSPSQAQESWPPGFRILFAGNIGTSQAFETILEAATRLKHIPQIQWIVLGDGLMKAWVEEEVKKRELTSCFHLLGSRPLESMPSYYQMADALLISLRKEPLLSITVPSKVQPCLASGRPIIASLDGEGAFIIEESGGGLTCSAGDPQELANSVLKLYELPSEERTKMGQRAQEYFRKNFEREKLISRLENLMQEWPCSVRAFEPISRPDYTGE